MFQKIIFAKFVNEKVLQFMMILLQEHLRNLKKNNVNSFFLCHVGTFLIVSLGTYRNYCLIFK